MANPSVRRDDPNLAMLQLVAAGLGPLVEDVVFVGGCAAGLLITDMAAPPTRETRDVDLIAEITTPHDYHELSEQLRKRGFREETRDHAIMCRWQFGEITVDVMPTEASILGFSNRWYTEAMAKAERICLPDGREIRLVAAPWFLATKLEAFYGRGNEDFMASHDLEDLIAILDGRDTIVEEVKQAGAVRQFLAEAFQTLLSQEAFLEALPCHLPADSGSRERETVILMRMRAIRDLTH